MKTQHKLALVALAAGALFGTAAQAQQLINFESSVVQPACTPNLDLSGGVDATINLPAVAGSSLKDIGMTAGEKTFVIDLTACGVGLPSNAKARAYFYNATANAVTDGRLNKLSGTGAGWQYQLLSKSGPAMTVGTSATVVPDTSDVGVSISAGTGTLQYRVRYYRNDSITNGSLVSNATYVLYYE